MKKKMKGLVFGIASLVLAFLFSVDFCYLTNYRLLFLLLNGVSVSFIMVFLILSSLFLLVMTILLGVTSLSYFIPIRNGKLVKSN